jgi:pantetheine-phosphate adenylyltransferase
LTSAVMPGSFDPVTYGHLDIIERASTLFAEVIIAVVENPTKCCLFSLQERAEFLVSTTNHLTNVRVDTFSGLLVAYMQSAKASVIVRGLRVATDFEYELQMALMNHELCAEVETVFLPSSYRYSFLSSSLVKEVALHGGSVTAFVPGQIEEGLKSKISTERG